MCQNVDYKVKILIIGLPGQHFSVNRQKNAKMLFFFLLKMCQNVDYKVKILIIGLPGQHFSVYTKKKCQNLLKC